MGFKCPVCLKDFARNKPDWEKHITTEHRGVGSDILNALKKVTEDKKQGVANYDIQKTQSH